jgi:RNA polymerase sigma factor (sigma-70 family)
MENQEQTPTLPISDFVQEIIDIRDNKEMSRQLGSEKDVGLVKLAKAGDLDALDKLVIPRLPLVEAIAESFRDKGVDYQDLLQEGDIGLMEATQSFDTDSDEDFSKYVVSKIRKSMDVIVQRECRYEDSRDYHMIQIMLDTYLSKLPDLQREILRMRFGFDSYRGHTLAEVGREFDIDVEEVKRLEDEAIKEIRRIY